MGFQFLNFIMQKTWNFIKFEKKFVSMWPKNLKLCLQICTKKNWTFSAEFWNSLPEIWVNLIEILFKMHKVKCLDKLQILHDPFVSLFIYKGLRQPPFLTSYIFYFTFWYLSYSPDFEMSLIISKSAYFMFSLKSNWNHSNTSCKSMNSAFFFKQAGKW